MIALVSKLSGSNVVILDSFSVYLIWILSSNLWWLNFQLEALGYQSFVSKVKISATDVDFGLTTADCYGGYLQKISTQWANHHPIQRKLVRYPAPACRGLASCHELSYQSTDPTTVPSNQPKLNNSFEYPPYQKSWESALLLILSLFGIWILIFLEIFSENYHRRFSHVVILRKVITISLKILMREWFSSASNSYGSSQIKCWMLN